MNLETRKLSFIKELLQIQNEEILIGLESLLAKWKNEFSKEEIRPMSLEQFNDEIDQSLKDSTEDNLIDALKLKEKWS